MNKKSSNRRGMTKRESFRARSPRPEDSSTPSEEGDDLFGLEAVLPGAKHVRGRDDETALLWFNNISMVGEHQDDGQLSLDHHDENEDNSTTTIVRQHEAVLVQDSNSDDIVVASAISPDQDVGTVREEVKRLRKRMVSFMIMFLLIVAVLVSVVIAMTVGIGVGGRGSPNNANENQHNQATTSPSTPPMFPSFNPPSVAINEDGVSHAPTEPLPATFYPSPAPTGNPTHSPTSSSNPSFSPTIETTIASNKPCYSFGDEITVTFTNGDPQDNDWVVLVGAGRDPNNLGASHRGVWLRTCGTQNCSGRTARGSLVFEVGTGLLPFLALGTYRAFMVRDECCPFMGFQQSDVFEVASTCNPTQSPTLAPSKLPTGSPVTTIMPTLATSSQPSTVLFQVIKELIISTFPSSEPALLGELTPQFRALFWVAGREWIPSSDSLTRIQQFALATLRFSTIDDPSGWNRDDGWFFSANECTWEGISCNNAASVIALDLRLNNLQGTIPPEVAILSNLTRLDLASNSLKGMIPSHIGLLTALSDLLLENNAITGAVPFQVCNISQSIIVQVDCNEVMCGCCNPQCPN